MKHPFGSKIFHNAWWISLLLMLSSSSGNAQFIYKTAGSSVTITGYTGVSGNVIIPDRINGLPVTTLDDNAFLEQVNVTNFTFGTNIIRIGNETFAACISISQIKLPASLKSIGEGAFVACDSLTNVFIPSGVTNVGNNAFGNCVHLQEISVDPDNPKYMSQDGVLFDHDQLKIIQCPGALAGNYKIPDGVTVIGNSAFNCCFNLYPIVIPNSVTNIEDFAFNNCKSLYEIMIPDQVRSIGKFAFSICAALTNIYIPSEVCFIGKGAFSQCASLKTIAVATNNPVYSSANGVLFDKEQTVLVQFPGGMVGSYTIPPGVISIYDDAFSSCAKITNIIVPSGLRNIGEWAFSNCSGLTSMILPAGLTNISYEAFFNCHLAEIYFQGNAPYAAIPIFSVIPDNAVIYYLPGTAGWGTSFAQCLTAQWYLPFPLILGTPGAVIGVQSNGFGFVISWATNTQVDIQASSDLRDASWQTIQTCTLTNGVAFFSEPQWTNYWHRFYRLQSH